MALKNDFGQELKAKVEIYETQALSIVNFSGKQRYIIVRESISFHCCFAYSVIDTAKGKLRFSEEHWQEAICETFDEESAINICYSLNKMLELNLIKE